MLNRTTTTPVRQIEPRNDHSQQEDRLPFRNRDGERPRSLDRQRRDNDFRAFVSAWQANHSTQRLTIVEIEASKIVEFTLSLDGRAADGIPAMTQWIHDVPSALNS